LLSSWLFFFSSTLSLAFNTPSHPPPTCHQTTSLSYTLITCWPTYCNNLTQPQPPAIPDTSTLHYNNRNTPKHTQGPQNSAAPTHITSLTHTPRFPHPLLVPPYPISQSFIAILTNVNSPIPTVCR
jgi:hypothetical protein